MERTLFIIKPDGVQRGLIGEIVSRLEKRGLQVIGVKFIQVSRDLASQHYSVHKGKPFYDGLIRYITSTPVLAMVFQGNGAIQLVRQTVGATNPAESIPGTIRHDLAVSTSRNLVHASDTPENAEKEIDLWFLESELFVWSRSNEDWFTGKN